LDVNTEYHTALLGSGSESPKDKENKNKNKNINEKEKRFQRDVFEGCTNREWPILPLSRFLKNCQNGTF